MDASITKNVSVNRGVFTTTLGAVVATLGSAVGLGNIWKFPYVTGQNGGAAFLIVYVICTLLVGLPVMVAEIAMGRKARANAVTTMERVSGNRKQPWWLIGALGAAAAFVIMAFYSEVAGWVYAYVFKAIGGGVLSTNPEVTGKIFTDLVTNPVQSLLWQWVVLTLMSMIIILGVTKGIERATKIMIPSLFVMVLIVAARSLTLEGTATAQGLSFLFKPDFSKITAEAVLLAMGLAFFKLSVGMGCMITYGSYWQADQNIPIKTTLIMFSDLIVSLLAGLAIFPAVYAFGFEPTAGPSLLFITIPAVFASMPLGQVFMVLFFLLTAFAANGAMLSLIEVPVAFLSERTKVSRTKAALITAGLLALTGSTAALSSSTLANFKLFGKTMFDLFDYLSSNIMLPVGGLFIAIFVGWVWGRKNVEAELSNQGQLTNQTVISAFYFVLRYITPVLVVVILLRGLGAF